MKIKVEIPHDHLFVIDASKDSGAILQALSSCSLFRTSGYGSETEYHEATPENRISFEIVKDEFHIKPHDAIAKLTEENKATSNRWLEAYQAKNKAESELKSIKEKIEKLGIQIS